MTAERLRRLHERGWRFERRHTPDDELDELVYENGPHVLHVRGPTDAMAVINGCEVTGPLSNVLDLLERHV